MRTIVGCDNEYCFYPIIYGTTAVCLECKYCVRREEINKELKKSLEDMRKEDDEKCQK